MKPRLIIFTSCLAGMLIGFNAVADSSRNSWNRSDTLRISKSDDNSRHSSHRLKIKTWDRGDSGHSRSSSDDGRDDRGNRSSGRDSRGGNEHRRSPSPSHRSPPPTQKAPPPRQQRTQHRPDHQGPDHRSGHRTDNRNQDGDYKPPRSEPRQPDHRQPDRRHNTPRPEPRPKDHRPEQRRDDRRDGHSHDNRRPDHRRPDHHRDHRPHTDYKPPRHDHHYDRRPKHHLYKRHKYIYYYTPWYNTWFLAPIIWHYHPIGYTLAVLPSTYIRIVVGGVPYFYVQGTFYRPYGSRYVVVAAPIGAVVTTLPAGYFAFSIGVNTYYYVNDAYYMWAEPRDAFVVVPKPQGADQAMTKATEGRLYAYPKEGQSEEQQAKDRYECHRWAVSESRVDPTVEELDYTDREKRDYKRAIAACLEGRGYSVK